MKKRLASLGLITALATSIAVVPSANAQLGSRDPKKSGCTDAQTLSSTSYDYVFPSDTVVKDSRNNSHVIPKGTRVTATVFLRGSRNCRGKWVRTTPGVRGALLYVEDNRGNRYVSETAKVTGEDYYSNMTNTQDYQRQLRACVEFQGKKLCTKFQ